MELITTRETATLLGVTPRRVRALMEQGALHGQKIGGGWMVDPSSVDQLRHQRRGHPGRRPSARIAWAALLSEFGTEITPELAEAFRIDKESRRLIRDIARHRVDDWRWLCAARSEVRRFRTRDAFLDRIATTPGLVPAGLGDADWSAVVSARYELDRYSSRPAADELERRYLLRPISPAAANLTIRVVAGLEENAERFVLDRLAMPVAVIAVDLMEEADERTNRAGAAMLEQLLPR